MGCDVDLGLVQDRDSSWTVTHGHAVNRHRQTIIGYVLLFPNAAIAWKSYVQLVVATSST